MPRFSRARYTSRRERMRRHGRAWRLAGLAVLLAAAVVLVFNWRDIYNYLRAYTY